MNSFQSQYLQEFPFDQDMALHDLAHEYARRTKTYDDVVCTRITARDGIRPVGPNELSRINRYAIAVYRELKEKAQFLGYNAEQFQKAVILAN